MNKEDIEYELKRRHFNQEERREHHRISPDVTRPCSKLVVKDIVNKIK